MAIFQTFLQQTVFKQYDIGPWVGAFKDLLGRTMFYMTPINLFMLAATTYHVTARDYIWQFAPWVNFWVFFSALVLVAVIAFVIEFKIIVPSTVQFSNLQTYKHGNLLRRDLEVVMQGIRQIEARLEAMEARYHEPPQE
ncbi:hypothetical protein ACFLX3_00590 [Chloroflexota bacterium]